MAKEGKTDPGDMVCDDAKVKEPTSEVVAAEDGNVKEPTSEVGVSDDVKVEGSTGEVVVADDAKVKGPKGKVGKGKRKKREQDVSNGENNVVSDDAKVKGQTGKVGKGKQKKRARDDSNGENNVASRRMPKRAAACSNFKEKAVSVSEKEHLLDSKREPTVENEIAAIGLTTGHDDPRPNRRLVDFIFHDGEGKAQPVELLEVTDLFISGVVLPLEPSGDIVKDKGVRCEAFGRIETWDISGYEDGAPTIWVSTELADYDCGKPAASFRKIYGLFYEKAHACIEVYKKLSRSSGGNPDITLDELLAALVRSMNGSKNFPPGASIKEFILSRGEFIYNQLIGLDATSSNKEQTFADLPVLVALRDEFKKSTEFAPVIMPMATGGSLKIGDGEAKKESNSSILAEEEDEDTKLARLLQEEEDWRFMNQRKGRRPTGSNKYYIKINEDEIATDYPLPAYYKPNNEETDEYIIFDSDMDVTDPDQLPRSMLHNWSLYNSDSRLVSLELLPMKPCDDIDVTIFGSGTVTDDDGSGFCLDADAQSSSASSEVQDVGGIPIYLSAIKEWMIEIGASMVFISVRTDMAWYRLGKPSKQYAPWYETVLKTARLAVGIITLLKEQSRVARLSFTEIVKRLAGFGKDHPAFISSNPAAVERYAVVHGQILLQQFAEFPDNTIRNCPFVTGLKDKMESRHHTKWLVKKKVVTRKGANLNPMAKMVPIAKRKLMPATTTRLINRIWGAFYSNSSPEESKDVAIAEVKEEEVQEEAQEEEDVDEDLEEEQEEKVVADKTEKTNQPSRPRKLHRSPEDIKWEGEPIQKTSSGSFYRQAVVNGVLVAVGGLVFVETAESEELPRIYLVEYMYEKSGGRKMVHGRLMLRGSQTVLGTAANEREVFLTNSCLDFDLGDVKETTVVETRQMPWGYQFRKAHALAEKADRENAEDRKSKGLPLEYYCKSSYRPHEGAFVRLQIDSLGLGNGTCHACKAKEAENEKRTLKVNSSKSGFAYEGIEYNVEDFFYVAPRYLAENEKGSETFKSGRNVGLKPYVICQFLEIVMPKASKKSDPESIKIKARRYFRPEDISAERAYRSDIREVYFSEQIQLLAISAIRGKCEVRRKHDLTSLDYPAIFEHIFFCEHLYDCDSGAIKQLPISVKLSSVVDDSVARKKKGKGKEDVDNERCKDKDSSKNQLATLDIFAGCGGLSEGLERAGVSQTKWAIEYEEPAGDAFNLNHPGASVFINNCNVILGAIMSACGDEDDCMSTPEASEEAKKLEEKEINKLPRPGDVDFINGGPPCQGFSGMNRFNKSAWSKVQCEMILAFLSFADYFRPKYFLLENVRNFVSFNKGQTFRLAIASLLEMGYQVRFGILDAGAFGVSQSRKRAFIWAASPEETLPDWPEPMHVFAGSELKITLGRNAQYAAVRSTAAGAPFRSITVRDTIGDLPAVGNGASLPTMEYKNEPVSWYQKMIRRDMVTLTDHISKEMNELNLIRCQKIPKRPGADWRDLPDEKVKLSTGQMADLVPWCLPNTAERHNQWKGLFGRLDWEGNFPTSITDPQPMGKVGMCFHPDQDRIVTVRECARSQGFPDTYKFSGNIQHRHRQIGNAVPPPLAFALGRKLKEAVEKNTSV